MNKLQRTLIRKDGLSCQIIHGVFWILIGISYKGNGYAATISPTTAPSYVRAVLIERYDDEGKWKPVPRKAIITGELADRLGSCFPEFRIEPHPPFTVTHERMRFEIDLTRTDGKEAAVWINPELTWWWDAYGVFKLNLQAAQTVLDAAKDAHDDESLVLKFPPVVKAEIIDREDGFLRLRKIPTKITYDGLQAELLARGFPEIGLKRVPRLADGGGYRFEVIFTRANGDRIKIHVIEEPGTKWVWYEDQSYWELSSDTAGLLLSLCRNAKEDPSTTMPAP